MKVPLEITFRDVQKSDAIEALIHEKVAKLEDVCNYITSCHIAVEKPHDRPRSGSPYRVRIDMTVPPGHELVADSNPSEGTQYDALDVVVRDAFDAARRQLKELAERQRKKVKTHEMQDMTAIVTNIFRDEGYGFIKALDGREVYFHRNSVLHDDFDRIDIGTGVHFFLEQGEEGPQASTVKIVNKPGSSVGKSNGGEVEQPLGWE
ncbi:MAG: HPF/RaiA family ribosome-associated protein [Aphanothece sp. CMT-3BRIN-NPC111]|jgi:cold shock CspA family protein|nr:HPF/RaiA family ribosome-associated protein [Aphanothece sp. CMT-3BRIN-NPC111]